ncbi:L-piperidine-6-carboxylate dehydrogenase [Pleomorphovibrio marinus]|uniref:L-piperidine-6-carboxylate dehydrogenase n=1 Tax=Pleomorphovibrio marinus TaxID=2164132 RepID=UPI000E0C7114|nr:aldehyde dehydrogenase family protein [Pleomorphovibrio marinus]
MEKTTIQEILDYFKLTENHSGASTGIKWEPGEGSIIVSKSPINSQLLGSVHSCTESQYEKLAEQALLAFGHWRGLPAPKRGEIIRQIGLGLRESKEMLGRLVSHEMGKPLQEGLGEVQEMIDICDFAVGLSRQLYGKTMPSERPQHQIMEQWHPLGPVGIISAFNFPVAVWSWNAMIAWVCGNVCIWKPSEKTPLSAIACQKIIAKILKENKLPEGISSLIIGDKTLGERLAKDKRIPLISATGSTKMGKAVAQHIGERLGKCILELGGNNAIVISNKANLDLAIRAAVFGAVGTAGQRCTSTRRLIIQRDVVEEVKERLKGAYAQLKVGDPLDENNHIGPLIDQEAAKQFESAIQKIKELGGREVIAGSILEGEGYESGCYVHPGVYELDPSAEIMKEETFAPLLYLIPYETLEEAIALHNNVPQGLSSAIMTQDVSEAHLFLSAIGSDCGIANVNIGTSGAEIGGAFGGEKETGGGRESGSDSWKAYMRRQTNTINFGQTLPLAQGIKFDL